MPSPSRIAAMPKALIDIQDRKERIEDVRSGRCAIYRSTTITPPSLNKPLPSKPVPRNEDSTERRGIFDVDDSVSKSLDAQFPPLNPTSVLVSGNDSFRKTDSLESLSNSEDLVHICMARAVMIRVARPRFLDIRRPTQAAMQFAQLNQHASANSAVVTPPFRYKLPVPRSLSGNLISQLQATNTPSRRPRRYAPPFNGTNGRPNLSIRYSCPRNEIGAASSVALGRDQISVSKHPKLAESLPTTKSANGGLAHPTASSVTKSSIIPPITNRKRPDVSPFKPSLTNPYSPAEKAYAIRESKKTPAQKCDWVDPGLSDWSEADKKLSSVPIKKRTSMTFDNVSRGFKNFGKKVSNKLNNSPRHSSSDTKVELKTLDIPDRKNALDKANDEATASYAAETAASPPTNFTGPGLNSLFIGRRVDDDEDESFTLSASCDGQASHYTDSHDTNDASQIDSAAETNNADRTGTRPTIISTNNSFTAQANSVSSTGLTRTSRICHNSRRAVTPIRRFDSAGKNQPSDIPAGSLLPVSPAHVGDSTTLNYSPKLSAASLPSGSPISLICSAP